MTRTAKQERIEELERSVEKLWRSKVQPVIIKPRSKKPMHTGWLEYIPDIKELIAEIKSRPDVNIGAILGEASNQVLDFDIDQKLAIGIARRMMPSTSCVFGRSSNPDSHFIYRVPSNDVCVSVVYSHPVTGKTIVELRGNSKMTVFPPSIHESGEKIEYKAGFDGEPSEVPYAVLCWNSSLVCCAFLLAEQWEPGSRHNKAKAFAGFCAANNIEERACENIIEAVVEAANDEEQQDRLIAIRMTYKRHRERKSIDGMIALTSLIGEITVQRIGEWMGVKPNKRPKREHEQARSKQEIADTDLDFARSFVQRLNGDMIYCDTDESFYERHADVYSPISRSKAQLPVHTFLDERLASASCDTEIRSIKRMKSAERMNAILKISQSLASVCRNNFDRNPKIAGCSNGVLDIENGILIKTSECVTRKLGAPFDPNADCTRFEQFLETTFAGNRDTILYLQRVLGYILSGLTTEHCMFIFVGEGSNGKSTLQNVIYKVMGEYASAASMQTLVKDKFGNLKTDDIAALEGCRYVFAQEGESNQSLAEANVKRMTGGDPISVRALYKTARTIQPVFKLCLFTNHIPKIDATDGAIWRRLHIIRFYVTIAPEDRIPGLDSILASEGSGILNWMIKGFQEFTRMGGLCPPQSIIDLRNEFRTENDTVEQFTVTCCDVTDREASTAVKLLYDTYVVWCSNSGIEPIATSEFGKSLQRLGYEVKRKKAGNHRLGIKLLSSLDN